MQTKQIILLGSGTSINEGINLNLFDKIKEKFTINLNYMHELFNATFLSFVDPISFYKTNLSSLARLPLIIGRYVEEIKDIRLNNTLLLPYSPTYSRDLNPGVYNEWLCGLWTLSLAIYLLDEGQIFLTGFDGGLLPPSGNQLTTNIHPNIDIEVEDVTDTPEKICNDTTIIRKNNRLYRPISHCYQDKINHLGVGRIKLYYETDKINRVFGVFKNETKCKIYNVSPCSRINTFEKIDYNTMFNLLDKENFNQIELQEEIKEKLKGKIIC